MGGEISAGVCGDAEVQFCANVSDASSLGKQTVKSSEELDPWVVLNMNTTGADGGKGQFATGKFKAYATSQQVKITGSGSPVIQAYQVQSAMAMGARFGGHLVQGHVDATLRVLDWSLHGQDHRLEVELPAEHRGLVIPKGSICLDGISLTAAEVTPTSVVCWIIPHTHQVTHLHTKQTGDRLNVEFDMLGKYVRELVKGQLAQA